MHNGQLVDVSCCACCEYCVGCEVAPKSILYWLFVPLFVVALVLKRGVDVCCGCPCYVGSVFIISRFCDSLLLVEPLTETAFLLSLFDCC